MDKSKKISRLNRLIYCEIIFTLFPSNSVISICITGSTKTHYGATRQNRTADPILTMDVLYLLSYGSIKSFQGGYYPPIHYSSSIIFLIAFFLILWIALSTDLTGAFNLWAISTYESPLEYLAKTFFSKSLKFLSILLSIES